MKNKTGFNSRISAPWGVSGLSVALPSLRKRLQRLCNAGIARIFGGRVAINHEAAPDQLAVNYTEAVSPISEDPDDAIMIAPYGEFPNPLGTQVVNRQVAERIVISFNSVLGKLGRLFRGVPVYRGHPDAMPERWPDDVRYGRIESLEARDDGLYGKPAWNSLGKDNVAQGFYVYPSPAWHFKQLGDGRIEPINLVSVGLTNTPNIREVAPLTNSKISDASRTSGSAESQQTTTKGTIMDKTKLIAALGLAAEATDEQILTAINSLTDEKKNPLVVAVNAQLASATTDKETALNDAKKFKKLAIDHELDLAINDGRLTAAERPVWAGKFEANFDGTAIELEGKQKALNTKSLGLSPSGKDLSDASKRRMAYNARIDELTLPVARGGKGLSLDMAINAMRADPEDAALLKAMGDGQAVAA